MSITQYTNIATDAVPHAVNHKEACSGISGWPDTKMTELNAECEKCGCTVGYMKTTHEGKVISTSERNYHDDSDFFAEVIVDTETLETESICYGTTRGWTYFNGANIDVSDELKDRYYQKKADAEKKYYEDCEKMQAELDAKVPTKGKNVLCTSKRSKIPYGTTGKVFWFGVSSYARTERHTISLRFDNHPAKNLKSYRVGIQTDDGTKVFASASVFKIV